MGEGEGLIAELKVCPFMSRPPNMVPCMGSHCVLWSEGEGECWRVVESMASVEFITMQMSAIYKVADVERGACGGEDGADTGHLGSGPGTDGASDPDAGG
jgi:hypothetical protein